MNERDIRCMKEALALAQEAASIREVPIGAVIVWESEIVGTGFNRREVDRSPLAHAEILAIAEAANRLRRWRLADCTLYTTCEPCPMCLGAILQARIPRLVFGCRDPKAGACGSVLDFSAHPTLNHRVEVEGGVLADEASALLQSFFKTLRDREFK